MPQKTATEIGYSSFDQHDLQLLNNNNKIVILQL